ncbi:OmpA family protein [Vibrio tapetis subsp. quintayensis]|uniref:OmpA family protein n=1 Tax=Vibrio tapetis TaxID=52443 RepID=UPI0025B6001D|nr:OmpA family protein [Vibrio tapetis]MDN3681421.1 OmpA family protein [Vibrio tapetis subsp. quintayensis]
MNRKAWLFTMIALFGSHSVLAQDVNQELNFYCNAANTEFEQSVKVGKAKTVLVNAGSFHQIEVDSEYNASVENLVGEMKRVGLTSQCAEFLVSQGSVKSMKEESDVYARVYFDFNKHQLTSQSRYVLRTVAAQLKSAPSDLIVEGHADSVGDHSYNFTLGLKRSETVTQYLVERGVEKESLVTISKGETTPIASNSNAQGRQKNRRVDLLTEPASEN